MWGAEEIADAIERAMKNFEALASQAEAGALVWRRNNGVGLFVDRLPMIPILNNHSSQPIRPLQSLRNALAGKIFDRLVSHFAR
jgi:hypothetical protein